MGAGGPKTQQGKAIVARNAVRHGVLSPNPVVSAVEKAGDWEAHRAAVVQSLEPEGGLETALAERVALGLWRLGRVVRFETEAIARRQESVEEDRELGRIGRGILAPALSPEDYERKAREFQQAAALLKRLPELPLDEPLSGEEAENLFTGLASALDISEVEYLFLPGLPPGQPPSSRATWTIAEVRSGWEAVCRREGRNPEEVRRFALELLAEFREQELQAAARVRREVDVLRRERLLPRPEDLEKVTRYEAHLSREFYRALHELEALQTHRRGGTTPLARLDINGPTPE